GFGRGGVGDETGAALVRAGLLRSRGARLHGRRGRVVGRRALRAGRGGRVVVAGGRPFRDRGGGGGPPDLGDRPAGVRAARAGLRAPLRGRLGVGVHRRGDRGRDARLRVLPGRDAVPRSGFPRGFRGGPARPGGGFARVRGGGRRHRAGGGAGGGCGPRTAAGRDSRDAPGRGL
ncbi:MAG: hypothetical protein AVDCRST_MAG05-2453, partial [uncultured Rubrobacteraceae bacterium]